MLSCCSSRSAGRQACLTSWPYCRWAGREFHPDPLAPRCLPCGAAGRAAGAAAAAAAAGDESSHGSEAGESGLQALPRTPQYKKAVAAAASAAASSAGGYSGVVTGPGAGAWGAVLARQGSRAGDSQRPGLVRELRGSPSSRVTPHDYSLMGPSSSQQQQGPRDPREGDKGASSTQHAGSDEGDTQHAGTGSDEGEDGGEAGSRSRAMPAWRPQEACPVCTPELACRGHPHGELQPTGREHRRLKQAGEGGAAERGGQQAEGEVSGSGGPAGHPGCDFTHPHGGSGLVLSVGLMRELDKQYDTMMDCFKVRRWGGGVRGGRGPQQLLRSPQGMCCYRPPKPSGHVLL